MEIKRDLYLKRIINRMLNGLVKVITGIRRCEKLYLLFELFYKYLKEQGVEDSHIIKLVVLSIFCKRERQKMPRRSLEFSN